MRKPYLTYIACVLILLCISHPMHFYATEDSTCEACGAEEPVDEEVSPDEPLDEEVPEAPIPDSEQETAESEPAQEPSSTETEAAPSTPVQDTEPESEEGASILDPVPEPSETEQDPVPAEGEDEEASTAETDGLETSEPTETSDSIQANGLLGVSLLSEISLSGAYSDRVELTLTGQGVLDLNLLKDRFVIFQIPSALMPYLDESSLAGSYEIPALIGVNRGTIATNQWVVDEAREQVYFRANQLLSVSVLNPKQYQFKLSFRLNRLPLGTPQAHTFYGHMTNELVRIDLLSDGRDAWTLETEGPIFQLNVPSAIDFGSISIRPSGQRIYRDQAMTVTVSHLRALGYAWRLTATATPLTSSGGHTLMDTVFFKREDGTIVSLEQGVQVIAEGTMTEQATPLTYGPTEGIFLNVQSQLPQPTTYQTTINWTLVNAP
ncbi:hypothetical protein [Exiguobacterium sp. s37]|uniref:hypothetical protein n=1 Tax=Exiguobacterium sp. s37 TaxID=2751275 RepID=UPI001BECB86D|nr:hypothetical protein [Exiguobacterium sp. s37]